MGAAGFRATEILYDVAFGNGLFAAVGDNGVLLTSPDGAVWTRRNSGTQRWLWGVSYGNGRFVATGLPVTGTVVDVLVSANGVDWSARSSGTANDLRAATYGNGLYVAVGYNGQVVSSSDGNLWVNRRSDIFDSLLSVAYGNGRFVAVGGDFSFSQAAIVTSLGAGSWTRVHSGVTNAALYAMTQASGQFVGVGYGGRVMTSADGASWSFRDAGASESLWGIVAGQGLLVAVGERGQIPDFVECANLDEPQFRDDAAAYGRGVREQPVRRGRRAGDHLDLAHAAIWTHRDAGTLVSLTGVTYANGRFVAVGLEGTILGSDDGVVWTPRESGTSNQLNSVAFGNGLFVAVGNLDRVVTSTDGVTWALSAPGPGPWLNKIAFEAGNFAAVSGALSVPPAIFSSADGANWTQRFAGARPWLLSIGHGNGTFLALGMNGSILQSDPQP